MVTRSSLRLAGIAAIATAALLTASLVLFAGGPASASSNGALTWFSEHADEVRISSALWLASMLSLVVFAIGFREAMWASVLSRPWMTVIFVHGAAVFATVAVVAAAVGWALADQASANAISPELAGTVWALERTLLRFATWGMTAPLIVVGLALYSHSLLGMAATVGAFAVAATLLIPLTWSVGLFAFCGWLILAGLTLLVPGSGKVRKVEMANH